STKLTRPPIFATSQYLFQDSIALFPSSSDNVELYPTLLRLQPGKHTWPFSFRVPPVTSLPPTYRGKVGNVRYEAVATIEYPTGSPFGVNSIRNRALPDGFDDPEFHGIIKKRVSRREIPVRSVEGRIARNAFENSITISSMVEAGSLWWKAGNIEVISRMPRTAFTFDEQMVITLDIINHTGDGFTISGVSIEERALCTYPDSSVWGPIVTNKIPYTYSETFPANPRTISRSFRVIIPSIEPRTPHPPTTEEEILLESLNPSPIGLNPSFTSALLSVSHYLMITVKSTRHASTPCLIQVPVVFVAITRRRSLLHQAAHLMAIADEADAGNGGDLVRPGSIDTLPVYQPRTSMSATSLLVMAVSEGLNQSGAHSHSRGGVHSHSPDMPYPYPGLEEDEDGDVVAVSDNNEGNNENGESDNGNTGVARSRSIRATGSTNPMVPPPPPPPTTAGSSRRTTIELRRTRSFNQQQQHLMNLNRLFVNTSASSGNLGGVALGTRSGTGTPMYVGTPAGSPTTATMGQMNGGGFGSSLPTSPLVAVAAAGVGSGAPSSTDMVGEVVPVTLLNPAVSREVVSSERGRSISRADVTVGSSTATVGSESQNSPPMLRRTQSLNRLEDISERVDIQIVRSESVTLGEEEEGNDGRNGIDSITVNGNGRQGLLQRSTSLRISPIGFTAGGEDFNRQIPDIAVAAERAHVVETEGALLTVPSSPVSGHRRSLSIGSATSLSAGGLAQRTGFERRSMDVVRVNSGVNDISMASIGGNGHLGLRGLGRSHSTSGGQRVHHHLHHHQHHPQLLQHQLGPSNHQHHQLTAVPESPTLPVVDGEFAGSSSGAGTDEVLPPPASEAEVQPLPVPFVHAVRSSSLPLGGFATISQTAAPTSSTQSNSEGEGENNNTTNAETPDPLDSADQALLALLANLPPPPDYLPVGEVIILTPEPVYPFRLRGRASRAALRARSSSNLRGELTTVMEPPHLDSPPAAASTSGTDPVDISGGTVVRSPRSRRNRAGGSGSTLTTVSVGASEGVTGDASGGDIVSGSEYGSDSRGSVRPISPMTTSSSVGSATPGRRRSIRRLRVRSDESLAGSVAEIGTGNGSVVPGSPRSAAWSFFGGSGATPDSPADGTSIRRRWSELALKKFFTNGGARNSASGPGGGTGRGSGNRTGMEEHGVMNRSGNLSRRSNLGMTERQSVPSILVDGRPEEDQQQGSEEAGNVGATSAVFPAPISRHSASTDRSSSSTDSARRSQGSSTGDFPSPRIGRVASIFSQDTSTSSFLGIRKGRGLHSVSMGNLKEAAAASGSIGKVGISKWIKRLGTGRSLASVDGGESVATTATAATVLDSRSVGVNNVVVGVSGVDDEIGVDSPNRIVAVVDGVEEQVPERVLQSRHLSQESVVDSGHAGDSPGCCSNNSKIPIGNMSPSATSFGSVGWSGGQGPAGSGAESSASCNEVDVVPVIPGSVMQADVVSSEEDVIVPVTPVEQQQPTPNATNQQSGTLKKWKTLPFFSRNAINATANASSTTITTATTATTTRQAITNSGTHECSRDSPTLSSNSQVLATVGGKHQGPVMSSVANPSTASAESESSTSSAPVVAQPVKWNKSFKRMVRKWSSMQNLRGGE
ncbi:Arrestin domain-containing protein 3, partial [Blyttiomyces sp. JEL0837]